MKVFWTKQYFGSTKKIFITWVKIFRNVVFVLMCGRQQQRFFFSQNQRRAPVSPFCHARLHHTPWLGAFEWLIFFSLFVFYHHLLLAVLMAALHSDDDDDAPNPLVSKPFQVSTATLLRINKPARQPFLIFVTYSHHYFWMPFLGICPGRKLLPFPCQAFP